MSECNVLKPFFFRHLNCYIYQVSEHHYMMVCDLNRLTLTLFLIKRKKNFLFVQNVHFR